MNQAQAIAIARMFAMRHTGTHSYLPRTECDADLWTPHEWVVDAILWAAGFKTSIPLVAAQQIDAACQHAHPREEIDIGAAHTLALFALSKALPQSAEERLSKLEADAKRYRWLSGNGWADPAFYATGPREWGANGVALLAGPQLDAAIDAAMAEGVEA